MKSVKKFHVHLKLLRQCWALYMKTEVYFWRR